MAILPSHGLTAGSVTPGVAWGETKTDLPTNPKWQIGLGLWQKPYRGGGGNAAGGAKRPPQGSTQRGWPPLGDSLVTFSSGRKSPGARGGAPSTLRAWELCSHIGERRGGVSPLAKRLPGAPPTRGRKRKTGSRSQVCRLAPEGCTGGAAPSQKAPAPAGPRGDADAVPAGGKCNSCTHGYHSCTNCAAGPALCYHRARRRNTP